MNRKGLCKEVTIKKAEETALKKTPGYCRYSTYGSLVYVAWFDKRPVHLLSNCYSPLGDNTVRHWYPAKVNESGSVNGKIQKEVFISPIVSSYNQFMGGVETFDQYRAYMKLEMRSLKFWHPNRR